MRSARLVALIFAVALGAMIVGTGAQAAGSTVRISVSSSGGEANGRSYVYPRSMSSDGRYVVMQSYAYNLGPTDVQSCDEDGNGVPDTCTDVYLKDTQTGNVELISQSTGGVIGSSGGFFPAISDDGRYVAFGSISQNLVPNDSGDVDIFVRDRAAGTTVLADISTAGTQPNGGAT